MEVARLVVGRDGSVMFGNIMSMAYIEIYNSDELRQALGSADKIYCGGLMDRLFSGERLIDFILDTYIHPECKIIPCMNVRYYSEKNRFESYKHIFFKESGRPYAWSEEEVADLSSPFMSALGKLTFEAITDYIKTSCSERRYKELMENAQANLEITKAASSAYQTKSRAAKRAYETAKYWERSVELGESLTAGIHCDGGFMASREMSNTIFAGVDDSKYYVINLYGFFNRLRFDRDQTVNEFVASMGGIDGDNPWAIMLGETNNPEVRQRIDALFQACIKEQKESSGYSEEQLKYIQAQRNLIEYIKSRIPESYIYDVSTQSISFVFRNRVSVYEAIRTVYEAAIEYMPKTFETLTVDHKSRRVNGATKYWDTNMLNVVALDTLKNIEKINPPDKDSKNTRLDAGLLFNKLKCIYV